MRVKTRDKCSIWWCNRPYYARGYCNTHWAAMTRYGSPYGMHPEEMMRMNDIIDRAVVMSRAIVAYPQDTLDVLHDDAKYILEKIGGEHVDDVKRK